MPNRYADTCYRCGEMCQPGDGVFEKVGASQIRKWSAFGREVKWLVQHHKCAAFFRGTAVHHQYAPATREQLEELKRQKGTKP